MFTIIFNCLKRKLRFYVVTGDNFNLIHVSQNISINVDQICPEHILNNN